MTRQIIYSILYLLFLNPKVHAESVESFTGTAKENGIVVYTEKHEVTRDKNNSVLKAKTTYLSPDGKVLATLESDFTQSLSLPDHTFFDERTKGKYGIRRDGNDIVLFNQDDGKNEQTATLKSEQDKDRIQVGCQGFNYFLKGRIDELQKIRSQPVLFMVPGDLSTYRFRLDFVQQNSDNTVDFKVKIENWFLRAFAPELEFRYDPKKERIIWYKGLSNIKNNAGKTMNVVIDYQY